MIRRILQRMRRLGRPAAKAAPRGLFFGPLPMRMPADWGPITAHPSYRSAHARLAALVETERGWRPEIGAADPPSAHITRFEYTFCSETLHQLALLAVIHAEDVRYDFVVAVSLGEYAAAAAAGVLAPEDSVAVTLGALSGLLDTQEGDLVLLPRGARLPPGLASPAPHLVMRGLLSEVRAVRSAELGRVLAEVQEARALEFGVLPHTPAVPVTALLAAAEPLAARAPATPFYTSSAGGRVDGRVDARYWVRMVREIARLEELLRVLGRLGAMELTGIGTVTLDSELSAAGVLPAGSVPSLSDRLRMDASRSPAHGANATRIDLQAPVNRRDSHAAYERCRHAELVPCGDRELLAIGHGAVLDVLRRSEDFSSAPNSTFPILHGADAPEHTRVRRALAPHFSPARQREREGSMRAATAQVVATLRDRDRFALVADFARPIPFRDTCRWLGLDESRAMSLTSLPPTQLRWPHVAPLLSGQGLLHELRAAGDSSDDEIAQLAPFLLTAGLTTVTDFVVNAVCALHERPVLLARLRSDPSLLGRCVDELLRLEPPVHSLPRLAVRDTEVAGIGIPAGTLVHCGFAAANRDPAVHHLANALLPDRSGGRSLTFGHGPHYCLGAAAGRAFSEILLGALLYELADFELAEDVHALLDRATPAFNIRRRVPEIELRRVGAR